MSGGPGAGLTNTAGSFPQGGKINWSEELTKPREQKSGADSSAYQNVDMSDAAFSGKTAKTADPRKTE